MASTKSEVKLEDVMRVKGDVGREFWGDDNKKINHNSERRSDPRSLSGSL